MVKIISSYSTTSLNRVTSKKFVFLIKNLCDISRLPQYISNKRVIFKLAAIFL